MNEKKMLSSQEAAEYLCVPLATLMKYNSERRIPYYKIGRRVYYKVEDLAAFVESCRVPASNENLK
jgi:excisionase family DNA binding protein